MVAFSVDTVQRKVSLVEILMFLLRPNEEEETKVANGPAARGAALQAGNGGCPSAGMEAPSVGSLLYGYLLCN
ncbi:hypothetical protein AV530_018792 [Patagioenas fasciata monilis]|uniref:Uncharacterized protein n=1 Tax=Patagioenas fasciata monilis TaxID=372326 RepID=A0A1V4JJI7_PATFA|nr:hypothetical protein AV530_018792 [Patagioenas fasciata monilis]